MADKSKIIPVTELTSKSNGDRKADTPAETLAEHDINKEEEDQDENSNINADNTVLDLVENSHTNLVEQKEEAEEVLNEKQQAYFKIFK